MATRFTGSLLGSLTNRTNLDADDEIRRAEGRGLKNTYVFGFTAIFSIGAIVITAMGFDGPVAERAVEGLLGLVELMIIFFLSTATIDRSEVLTNIGKGVRARAEQPQIVVQTPEEARAASAASKVQGTTVMTTGDVTVDSAKDGDQSVG
jgi:hypothetical protein